MGEPTNEWIDPNLMDSHQQGKHKRITAIAKLLEKRQKADYKRFLAEMQYHGLRKTVAEEYLEVLKDLGTIKIEGNKIIWNSP